MKPVSISDFSGGISENLPFDAFAPDSVARAKGFILDGTTQLRTQWACESVGATQFQSIYGFDARVSSFLVGIKTDGTIHYTVAPDDYTAVGSVTWTAITTGTREAIVDVGPPDAVVSGTAQVPGVAIPADTRYRFVCELPDDAARHTYASTVSNDGGASSSVSENSVVLFAGNGLLINACYDDGSRPTAAIVLREDDTTAGVLSATVFDQEVQRYPELVNHASIPDQSTPRDNVMPHANVGAMWGDRLFLADVFWYSEPTEEGVNVDTTVDDSGTPDDASDDITTVTTTYQFATMQPSDPSVTASRRYRNAMWVSEAGFPYTFDNLSLDLVVSDDCQIVDLQVVSSGMLVYTTNAAGESGLVLLRGTAGSYQVEKLRNISAPRRASGSDEKHYPVGTMWQASGSFVCVDRLGGVWASNGDIVLRLDGPASVDFRNGASYQDHTVALGQYLFLSHSGRLLCMRAFGDTAGWTELLTPADGAQVSSMTTAGNSLYFLQGNNVFRYACGRTSGYGDMPAGSSSDEFTFGSSTLVIPTRDADVLGRSQWHRVALVLSGDGELVDVTSRAAPALTAGDEFTVAVGEAVGVRSQHVVPAGIGFVLEGSVLFRVRGDVSVESVTLWASAGKRSW